jgi:hypothetical protein
MFSVGHQFGLRAVHQIDRRYFETVRITPISRSPPAIARFVC